jgi:hypothetical protein
MLLSRSITINIETTDSERQKVPIKKAKGMDEANKKEQSKKKGTISWRE